MHRTGGFSQYAVYPASAVMAKPASLTFAQAAALGSAYLTAYVALVRCADIKAGEWLLVHGASGGVGLATVDLGRALGARVIAAASSRAKLDTIAAEYSPAALLESRSWLSRAGQSDHGRGRTGHIRSGRRRHLHREHPLHRLRRAAARRGFCLRQDSEHRDQHCASQGLFRGRRAGGRVWSAFPRPRPREQGRDPLAGSGAGASARGCMRSCH